MRVLRVPVATWVSYRYHCTRARGTVDHSANRCSDLHTGARDMSGLVLAIVCIVALRIFFGFVPALNLRRIRRAIEKDKS